MTARCSTSRSNPRRVGTPLQLRSSHPLQRQPDWLSASRAARSTSALFVPPGLGIGPGRVGAERFPLRCGRRSRERLLQAPGDRLAAPHHQLAEDSAAEIERPKCQRRVGAGIRCRRAPHESVRKKPDRHVWEPVPLPSRPPDGSRESVRSSAFFRPSDGGSRNIRARGLGDRRNAQCGSDS